MSILITWKDFARTDDHSPSGVLSYITGESSKSLSEKSAQSIVFGGGPPIGGKFGDSYDLPKKNPLETLGDLGSALHEGTGELGRYVGKKNGFNPEVMAQTFQIGSTFLPVYGTAVTSGRLADAFSKGNYSSAAGIISTSDAFIERMLPHAVHAGIIGYQGSGKVYSALKKWLDGMRSARRATPALAPAI